MFTMDEKIVALSQIYRVLEDTFSNFTLACHRGCAACCTLNVTMTTLEAYQIISHLNQAEAPDFFEKLSVSTGKYRFETELTLNALAHRYVDSNDIPEEQPPPQQPTDNALATIEVFEFINQALNNQAEQHRREISAKNETIALLREELARARQPWYKRLFGGS